MPWVIEFYETEAGRKPVEAYLEGLSDEEREKVFEAMDHLEEHGLDLGLPLVRPIEDKLYEIRVQVKRNRSRILYVAIKGQRFLFLHGFTKKTPRTPREDIDLAKRRFADWRKKHE